MKKLLLYIGISLIVYSAYGQVPQGINYQALARNSDGQELSNEDLKVRISIKKLDLVLWQEEQEVKTNDLGLFSLVIGGEPENRTGGIAESFEQITWELGGLTLALEINAGAEYVSMGESPMMSVPYALYAASGPTPEGWQLVDETFVTSNSVQIMSLVAQEEIPLFVVKNHLGNPIFAVYNDGVIVYVDEKAKGIKGGFAVGGYNTATKGLTHEFLRVTPDSVRIYVPDKVLGKGIKGGFAVGGYNTATKQGIPYLQVTPEFSTFNGALNIAGDLSAATITQTEVKSNSSVALKMTEYENDTPELLEIIMNQQKQIEILQEKVNTINVLESRLMELESRIAASENISKDE